MANKTIHELTPASTVSSDYQFAVYDVDGNTTKKASVSAVLGTEDLLYADDDTSIPDTVNAEIKTIKSHLTDDTICPITKSNAVYMAGSTTDTVDDHLTDLETLVGDSSISNVNSTITGAIGNNALTTTAQTLSGAINELNTNFIIKRYNITPTSNSSVSPFSAYTEYDLSNEIALYGNIASLFINGGGSTNPVEIKMNNNRTIVWCYAKTANTELTLNVLYKKII